MMINVHLWQYLSDFFFSELENQNKFYYQKYPPPRPISNFAFYEKMCKNIVDP